jgi:hypothetical protein
MCELALREQHGLVQWSEAWTECFDLRDHMVVDMWSGTERSKM